LSIIRPAHPSLFFGNRQGLCAACLCGAQMQQMQQLYKMPSSTVATIAPQEAVRLDHRVRRGQTAPPLP
jgi:hypothetical protein